jgi:hypothetical protein
VPHGISFVNPEVCGLILCSYNTLKNQSAGAFHSDLWAIMFDFDDLLRRALANYPMYRRIVKCKINGVQNTEIQKILEKEFGVAHSTEYISSLWRKKIPQVIASQAEDDYLDWYYLEVEKG